MNLDTNQEIMIKTTVTLFVLFPQPVNKSNVHCSGLLPGARADFHLFRRRGKKISGEVQVAPLSELRQS